MSISVQLLSPALEPAWDRFVDGHPQGTPFHLLAWKKSIEETFGYEPQYLAATEGAELRGVLPLFLVRSILTGKALISSPFSVYGGILAHSQEARDALRTHAAALGESLDVQYVELRNVDPAQCGDLPRATQYVDFTQQTVADGEELLQALPKKTRNLVRKSLRFPYSTRLTREWRIFEDLYSRNLRRLGTPCFPRSHFGTLLKHFGSLVDIREICLGEKVVAASMNFLYRGQMHTYYAASDQRYLAKSPNNYLYYDHILWAGQNGYPIFDFGRSKRNTGTFEFKRHWNTEMRELPYEIRLVRRKELPNFTPTNSKFHFAIEAWKRIPLPVARMLGPRLIRLVP